MRDAPSTGDQPLVRLETRDQVAWVTLDSPRNRNALSRRLVGELLDALDRAERDPGVVAVVLAAAGPAFCSGADLSEAAAGGMEQGTRDLVALQRAIVASDKPVLARVHAAVRAGGLGLVGAADVVVCADTVTFAFTEARLGLAPAAISLTTLPRLTSRGAASTFLGAEPFDAPTAVTLGLVTLAVSPEELDCSVEQVTSSWRACSAQGLRETKRLLNAPLVARIDAMGQEMARTSARLFDSAEAKAAMRTFLASAAQHRDRPPSPDATT